MKSQLLSPSKQSKPFLRLDSSLTKAPPLNKIPRRLFSTAFPDRITRNRGGAFLEIDPTRCVMGNKEVWAYLCRLKKVYRCKLINHLDIGLGRTPDPMYPRDDPEKLKIDSLRNFPEIKKLVICFKFDPDITNDYVQSLMIDICHTLQLEELDFMISRCEQISLETLRTSIIQIARHQIGLKKLTIWTPTHPRIDNEGLELIGYEVGRHLVNLESLSLWLNESHSWFNDRSKLVPVLDEFKALKGKTQLSDKGLKALGLHLGRFLINLRSLAITMDWVNEISDKGLKGFISGIGKDLGHLRSLELLFRECQSLTGSGMKSTATEICKHFKSLESLDYNLERCEKVFPNDVKAVKNKIQKELALLTYFRLNNMLIVPAPKK